MANINTSESTLVVIKKKASHASHHGGAWKVAYADFVTALMALFIVLWLLASSEEVQKAVGGYFLDPTGHGNLRGSSMAGSGEALMLTKENVNQLKEQLEQMIKQAPELSAVKDQVLIVVTGEGLRIELLETENGTFFESGSAKPTQAGEDLLKRLAAELGKLPNEIVIEGHTDSRPFRNGGTYTNWELAADRANAARRILEANGIRPGQISQIRGYADRKPLKPENPEHPSNRRVSIIVKYTSERVEPAEGTAKPKRRSPVMLDGAAEGTPAATQESSAPQPQAAANTDHR